MPYHEPPKICPVCKEKANFKFIQDYQNEWGKWSLFECSKCEVQFWMPFKAPGYKRYEEYKKYLDKLDIISRNNCKWMVKKLWNMNQFFKQPPYKNSKGKKLLDLGCGTGEFLVVAQNLGYKVYGVDFNKYAVEIARNYLGLKNVFQEDIFNFLENRKSEFDVITGFEIFEHVDEPKKFLELIYRALKPNGYLILSFPNRNRYWGKIDEKIEDWDFPPLHLTRWNLKTAVRFIENNSFEVIIKKKQIPMNYFLGKMRKNIEALIKIFRREKRNNFNNPITQIRKDIGIQKFKITRFFIVSIAKCIFFIPALLLFYFFKFEGVGLYILARKK